MAKNTFSVVFRPLNSSITLKCNKKSQRAVRISSEVINRYVCSEAEEAVTQHLSLLRIDKAFFEPAV